MQKYPVPSSLLQSAPSPLAILSLEFTEVRPPRPPPAEAELPSARLPPLPPPPPRPGMESRTLGSRPGSYIYKRWPWQSHLSSPISCHHLGAPGTRLPHREQVNDSGLTEASSCRGAEVGESGSGSCPQRALSSPRPAPRMPGRGGSQTPYSRARRTPWIRRRPRAGRDERAREAYSKLRLLSKLGSWLSHYRVTLGRLRQPQLLPL